MKNKKLIIYGIGEFAEYIAYAFKNDSEYEVVAFCVESEFLSTQNANSEYPVLEFEKLSNVYPPELFELFIAVGNDRVRERIFSVSKERGYILASYISSKAICWENLIYGENVFISEDSGIQPFVEVKENTIIIGAKIGHHSVIGKNVLLSLTFIGANVTVGDNSFLGLNSAVKPNLKIGSRNIIGMGCNIINSTKDGEIYSAPKAKKRSISSGRMNSKYLN